MNTKQTQKTPQWDSFPTRRLQTAITIILVTVLIKTAGELLANLILGTRPLTLLDLIFTGWCVYLPIYLYKQRTKQQETETGQKQTLKDTLKNLIKDTDTTHTDTTLNNTELNAWEDIINNFNNPTNPTPTKQKRNLNPFKRNKNNPNR